MHARRLFPVVGESTIANEQMKLLPGVFWIGPRGEDAEIIADLGCLTGIACCDWSLAIEKISARISTTSIERYSGRRECWSSTTLDQVEVPRLQADALLIPYAALDVPSGRLAAPPYGLVRRLADKAFQTQLFRELDIPVPPTSVWCRGELPPKLRGPFVIRRRTGSLGIGASFITDLNACYRGVPEDWRDDSALVVAQYVEGPVVNVHVVVAEDEIYISWPSIQVFGQPACGAGPYRFLYCGNDLSAASTLPDACQACVRATSTRIGEALRVLGYRGIMGLDFIWDGDAALLLEINPRMQGSTALLANAERGAGLASTGPRHVAAFTGKSWPGGAAATALEGSELVLYNDGPEVRAGPVPTLPDGVTSRCFPLPGTRVAPGAPIGRLRLPGRSIDTTMSGLDHKVARLVEDVRASVIRRAGP